MFRKADIMRFLGGVLLFTAFACSTADHRLTSFMSEQEKKIVENEAYVQANFDFWAAAYMPTKDDLQELKVAWREHGKTFPESNEIQRVEREVDDERYHVVLVGLFQTEYDDANLKDKSLGWAVHPVPELITELSQKDIPLRVLMPLQNKWARYFLLGYRSQQWNANSYDEIVVSNETSKVALKLIK